MLQILTRCFSTTKHMIFENVYALLTKLEVNMAEYWPSSFSAFLWTETKSRSIKTQKRTRPISSHLDRTSLVKIKDLLYGQNVTPLKYLLQRASNVSTTRDFQKQA